MRVMCNKTDCDLMFCDKLIQFERDDEKICHGLCNEFNHRFPVIILRELWNQNTHLTVSSGSISH